MESADSGGDGYDQVATELARLREALDEIRRRPAPLDADAIRHVITASLSEASAPPPNLLVTAIRRLDRVDARLESIESALSGQAALPPAASGRSRGGAAAAPVASVPSAPAPGPPAAASVAPVNAEAIADVLARRLGGMLSTPPPGRGGGGPSVEDLVASLRPLVPGAARNVLRRGGREPSAQAVEVLQQAALAALEEAAGSLGPITAHASPAPPSPWAQPLPAPAAVALPAPGPGPAEPPPPPPLDVEALASTIATRVTAGVTASVAKQLSQPEPPAGPPAAPPHAPPVEPQLAAPPTLDPTEVADLVVARLAEQPPPQAVVSAPALVPLLAAVGNVEAAVARLAEPDEDVVGAVARLEAGIDALARALEDDRAAQADEVRRGFVEVTELVRDQQAASAGAGDWTAAATTATGEEAGGVDPEDGEPAEAEAGKDAILAAVVGLHRRLDGIVGQLAPLSRVDLSTAVPALESRGQRLERSTGHILTALAAVADHLSEQATLWRAGLDGLAVAGTGPTRTELAALRDEVSGMADAVRALLAGGADDPQGSHLLQAPAVGLTEPPRSSPRDLGAREPTVAGPATRADWPDGVGAPPPAHDEVLAADVVAAADEPADVMDAVPGPSLDDGPEAAPKGAGATTGASNGGSSHPDDADDDGVQVAAAPAGVAGDGPLGTDSGTGSDAGVAVVGGAVRRRRSKSRRRFKGR